MFSLKTIELEDFKSYTGKHTFEFPTEPGLYFLTGDNQNEPSLESNGAGKSTLLDAIYWCLYGCTLRGLTAGHVPSWGKQSCTVSLELQVGEDDLKVTRTHKPNSQTVIKNGEEFVLGKQELWEWIGLNPQSFKYSVILPQFGESFFELTPSGKLDLFSSIMELEHWLDKSLLAKTKAEELTVTRRLLTDKIAHHDKLLGSMKDDIGILEAKDKGFEAQRDIEITQLEHNADRVQKSINAAMDRQTSAERQLKKLKITDATIGNELVQVREALDDHTASCTKLSGKTGAIKSVIIGLERTLERLATIKAQCPTCLQVVDEKHLKKEKRKVEDELSKQLDNFTQSKKLLDNVTKFAKADRENLDVLIKEQEDVRNQIGSNETAVALSKSHIEEYAINAVNLGLKLKQKQRETNPFADMLAQKKAYIANLEDDLAEQKDRLKKYDEQCVAVGYWNSGFKRIRLFIIEETLRTLEIEVNNNLANLGLPDWSVEFDVERENKSGGMTKGFVVLIRCPSNPEPVRWESWSGGETQRLQLAGDFGLANLIMAQAGLVNDIEFYDEPSNHLSESGLVDLAETLHQRALNDRKRIFLVDHRMPDFGEFSGVYTVVKDKTGSQICKA